MIRVGRKEVSRSENRCESEKTVSVGRIGRNDEADPKIGQTEGNNAQQNGKTREKMKEKSMKTEKERKIKISKMEDSNTHMAGLHRAEEAKRRTSTKTRKRRLMMTVTKRKSSPTAVGALGLERQRTNSSTEQNREWAVTAHRTNAKPAIASKEEGRAKEQEEGCGEKREKEEEEDGDRGAAR